MKIKLFIIFLTSWLFTFSQNPDTSCLNIISWNIQNLGKTKAADDATMNYICNKVKKYDIIAVQEVSTSEFGSQAVAKLDDLLDRTGTSWDYIVSDPTTGAGSERYAYLWKKNRVSLKSSGLEKYLQDSINREPFRATFIWKSNEWSLFNLHLVPTDKHPQIEAKKLALICSKYPGKRFLLMGDMNLSQSDKGFDDLKKCTFPAIIGKKTSLKMKEESGQKLNAEYDNFFISKGIKLIESSVIYFFDDFKDLKSARKISDHCPIYCKIKN